MERKTKSALGCEAWRTFLWSQGRKSENREKCENTLSLHHQHHDDAEDGDGEGEIAELVGYYFSLL